MSWWRTAMNLPQPSSERQGDEAIEALDVVLDEISEKFKAMREHYNHEVEEILKRIETVRAK